MGREALREKPRESSGPGSSKSGHRLPKGAGVSSQANEGRRCEISFLTFGSFSPVPFIVRLVARQERSDGHLLPDFDFEELKMNQQHQDSATPLERKRRNHTGAACVAYHLRREPTFTLYCFRHPFAADMKASGQLDSGVIPATLRRPSDATKSTYGHANMRKGRGVAPARVTAARTFKMRAAIKAKPLGKEKK
jgi:hypothetical protein